MHNYFKIWLKFYPIALISTQKDTYISLWVVELKGDYAMQIISTRFSNVRVMQGNQRIFGLVTFDTDRGLIHIECSVVPTHPNDIADPHPLLLAEAKAKVRASGNIPAEVHSVTVHDMLMSRVA